MENIIRSLTQKIDKKRAETVVSRVKPYLLSSKKIVDIGSGSGYVSSLLKSLGKDVTPVDVADFHGPRILQPVVYNGMHLPFKNMTFDTALVLMVLHHTPDPDVVFSEVARVAKNIVVIETSYTSLLNKIITVVADTIGNLRFLAHWKSYKSDNEWRKFFDKHGFKVEESKKYYDRNVAALGASFLHILYYLKR